MENNVSLIEHFTKIKDNGVVENFQIVLTNEALYLVNSSNNYGDFVKSIFSGVGDIMGLFGDGIGIIGGLASEATGHKLSRVLKQFSADQSSSRMNRMIKNIDKLAAKKKDVRKIEFNDLAQINIKKSYLVNGKAYVEFVTEGFTERLIPVDGASLNTLREGILSRDASAFIVAKLF